MQLSAAQVPVSEMPSKVNKTISATPTLHVGQASCARSIIIASGSTATRNRGRKVLGRGSCALDYLMNGLGDNSAMLSKSLTSRDQRKFSVDSSPSNSRLGRSSRYQNELVMSFCSQNKKTHYQILTLVRF